MTHDITIEILITGEGMSPGKLRSNEIAEVIESIEDMIASLVVRNNPTLNKEDIVIGLQNIRKGSIGLIFCPNLRELTLPATRQITTAIQDNEFGSLPHNILESLKKLAAFARRNNCQAEFLTKNGKLESLAVVTPETKIPNIYPLSGETTLYGEVIRVGGAEPRILLRTFEGQLVYCNTTKKLATIVASRLYTKVGLLGIAQWNSETFEIENFEAKALIDYDEVPLSEAFNELSDLIGDSMDQIEDVDRFVHEIRYGFSEA
jgi:hypothetical protein